MRIPSNKISSVIEFFKNELKQIYPSGEISEFIFLAFEAILNFSKTDLLTKENETMSESELLKFNNIVKDLKKQKPIQYILGTTKFYGIDLIVNEHVLIPRPETEELVDLIIKNQLSSSHQASINILDIGTGSGCIAVALKKNIPQANLYALDVSEKVLEVAKANAQKNSTEIIFIQANILNSTNLQNHFFDIIISNPPYITHSEKRNMQKNVLDYEPHQALFVDDKTPLLFYESIAGFALNHLNKEGRLFFEINEKYGQKLIDLLKQKSFKNILLQKDINGKNRILCCTI